MNLIIDDSLNVNAPKNKKGEISLSELNFYVPKKFNSHNISLLIQDSLGNINICKLDFVKSVYDYKIYVISNTQKLNIKDGKCKCKFILLNIDMSECVITKGIDLNINTYEYKSAYRLYVSKELESSLSSIYKDISELTNINIEIYKKIQECKGGGELC